MKERYRWITLGVLLALLIGVVGIHAAPNAVIDWHVIGGGGDSLEQGTSSLYNTLGQPVTGRYSGTGLCVGFWCLNTIEYQVFVPMVLRDY